MMRRRFCRVLLLAGGLCAASAVAGPRVEQGSLSFDGIPEPAEGASAVLDGYLSGREAAVLGWSPQGELLIATRFGDTPQLHVVAQQGGARRQISFLAEAVDRAAFSPDPGHRGLLYFSGAARSAAAQLYYQGAPDAAPLRLSDGKSANGCAVWSNSGHTIAFYSTARDGVSRDVQLVEPESGAFPHLAMAGDSAAWCPLDWSPDDRQLLVLKTVSAAESYLYVVDVDSGQRRELDPAPSKNAIKDARFARDGQGVYYLSDRDSEYLQLHYVNFFNGQKTVLSNHIPWDIEQLALSRDGRYLAFVSNEDGLSRLNLLDLIAHKDLIPPRLPAPGVIGALSFDPDGKRLAFGYAAANHPGDAFVLDLESNRLEEWTRSEAGPVDLEHFVLPRRTQFPTFDRQGGGAREIPAFVYEPKSAGPHPVLIMIHAAADGQFRPGFDPWIAYAVQELKFAVVAPNLRGSSGYGKSYRALDDGALRADTVKDLGAMLVWIRSQKSFDSKRVVIAGAGYGGFLALDALVNYGDRLRGAVDFGGITDFVGFMSGAAPDQLPGRRSEFGDERDPETHSFLRRLSPLVNAERITKPVLIVHGANDGEVPVTQAEQLVNRLRSLGVEAWYLSAGDEGSEFRQKRARDAYYRTFAEFLATLP